MLFGPIERRWLRYLALRDWLAGVGACGPCGMGLALWLEHRDTPAPVLLPCRRPKWKQGKCIDLVRAAWAERPQERRAA